MYLRASYQNMQHRLSLCPRTLLTGSVLLPVDKQKQFYRSPIMIQGRSLCSINLDNIFSSSFSKYLLPQTVHKTLALRERCRQPRSRSHFACAIFQVSWIIGVLQKTADIPNRFISFHFYRVCNALQKCTRVYRRRISLYRRVVSSATVCHIGIGCCIPHNCLGGSFYLRTRQRDVSIGVLVRLLFLRFQVRL